MESPVPIELKRIIRIAGVILLLAGLPFILSSLCIVPLALISDQSNEVIQFGVLSWFLALLISGTGFLIYWHADRSIKTKPSQPLRLPSLLLLIAIFIPLILLGLIASASDRVVALFPVILLAAATLPPLWAVAWMIPYAPASSVSNQTGEDSTTPEKVALLTWRRALLSFTGGATVSFMIALILEIILPVIVLTLIFNLADAFSTIMRSVVQALVNRQFAEAISNPGFIFLFIQLAVIAPLVEEIAKPLAVLPLLKNLSRQQAFWLGALAGAGFAAVENVIYATAGLSIWAGILVIRALGSALHPLGAGLVATGWRDVLNHEEDAHATWWRRYGIAVAIHAAWNGGSLLLITLGGAGFFGTLPPQLEVLGVSATGLTLAFLILLGLSALWIGRAYGHDQPLLSGADEKSLPGQVVVSDQTVAIWAVICLIAIVPTGIVGLKLWLR